MTKAKRQTIASRVRTLRDQGMTPRQISAIIGCNIQLVYNINHKDKINSERAELKKIKETARVEPAPQSITYVEPEPKLSFMQRLRVLFTGVV